MTFLELVLLGLDFDPALKKYKPAQRQNYLRDLFSSKPWDWGLKHGYIECNPWIEVVSGIKVPPKQPPKLFSREEIGAIVQAFRTDRYYNPAINRIR